MNIFKFHGHSISIPLHLDRYPTSADPVPLAAEHPPHPRFPYSTAAADPPHPSPTQPALLFDDIFKKIITVL